ncbi:MAG: type II secretion system F family protein [Candidatus Nanopelagicales bacterium]
MSAAGALIGAALAAGILLILAAHRAHRPPRLVDRIASPGHRVDMRERSPFAVLQDIARPLIVDRWGAGGDSLIRRLRQAGRAVDPARYRLESLIWAAGGTAGGLALGVVFGVSRGAPSLGAAVLLAAVGAGVGWLLHDRVLSTEVKRRSVKMAEQLPTVADLLAFAVAAGEAPIAAMERVSATLRGELPAELTNVVYEVRGGTPFIGALRDLADGVPATEVARFVDGIAVASERGTPMADVLRAQAADARASGRRQLIERAGRKEILMLVPVVFLILPIVVVIALFPGLHGLNLTA